MPTEGESWNPPRKRNEKCEAEREAAPKPGENGWQGEGCTVKTSIRGERFKCSMDRGHDGVVHVSGTANGFVRARWVADE